MSCCSSRSMLEKSGNPTRYDFNAYVAGWLAYYYACGCRHRSESFWSGLPGAQSPNSTHESITILLPCLTASSIDTVTFTSSD